MTAAVVVFLVLLTAAWIVAGLTYLGERHAEWEAHVEQALDVANESTPI